RVYISVIGVDVRRGKIELQTVADEGLHLELSALDLCIACIGVYRRDALLNIELDAVVVGVKERGVGLQAALEPLGFQTELPGFGVLRMVFRNLGARNHGRQAGRPPARLEALP